MEHKIYLSYGSNLNIGQMQHRCPHAKIIVSTILKGYRLLFRGTDGNAVATIEPCESECVPALLWSISPRDERKLDYYENYPELYRKENLRIKTANGAEIEAMAYIMNDKYPIATPNNKYFNSILKGYITAGFDTTKLYMAANMEIP